jgi:hypothetical protein
MHWKSGLISLALTLMWMLVLSTTTVEATAAPKLSKSQLKAMLGKYKPVFKRVIFRMSRYLDKKRAKNGLRRRDEEVTADDMKRGIQSTFGSAWVRANVKSINRVMSAHMAEHYKQLRKRSEEGGLTEEQKAQMASAASKAAEKQLRNEFKRTGKDQLNAFVELANEQKKPKGALFK